ncbi:MAG: transcription termination factor NusA [Thermoguttaceae bacterium]|nr:transcription termination factor NusA [Thermoguttaceae bacterium]
MDQDQVKKIVEQLHLERKIPKEKVFGILEEAMMIAAKRHAGQESEIAVHIDRDTCAISVFRDNVPLSDAEITERLGAQTARQVITQKIRDAEKDMIFERYNEDLNNLISGTVRRVERGVVIISLQENIEAILPRSEQIPGESFREGNRVTAQIIEVNKNGNNARIRIVLSRNRPSFLRKLLEQEIPEIADGIITIKELSRDPGHRAKVAVACTDPHLDLVGACVGSRGSRIRAVREELPNNEQIDIIPWVADDAEFIKSALQPAEILEVIPCPLLGRAIVLVDKEERSKAIGRKGQNVRLATRLCGWDLEILTQEELQSVLDTAVDQFKSIPGMTDEAAEAIVAAGLTTYDDIALSDPAELAELGKFSEEDAQKIIDEAERRAELDTALQASETAAAAAEEAVRAADEARRTVAADVPHAERCARDARDAAARAREAASEAAKSAEMVDSAQVAEAAQAAQTSAALAARAADTARALVDSARDDDRHRGQSFSRNA